MKYCIAGVALLATCWAGPAFAQNRCAQFQVIGSGARPDYNPFDPMATQDTFQIRVDGRAEGVRGVRFLLVDTTPRSTGAGLGDNGPLDYDVRWVEDTGREVFVVGNQQVTMSNGAEARLRGRESIDFVTFQLRIPKGQAAPARTHREGLLIRYQCLNGAGQPVGSQQEQSAPVEVAARIPEFAAAYIGGAGRTRGTIDFGQITANSSELSKRISVTALSTVPYEVLFESDNDGRLRRRGEDGMGIAYTMSYGGTDVSSRQTVICPTTPAPRGAVEDFEVTLDGRSVAALPAGDYSDVVTLTFSPRDVANPAGCTLRRR